MEKSPALPLTTSGSGRSVRSRKDRVGSETVTTFDLRVTSPNDEPVMNTAEVHTIEHLAATYLRNDPTWKDRVLYFGPMGCRTGFYLLLTGDLTSREALPLVRDCFRFIRDYEGEVPEHPPGIAAIIWT